MNSRKWTAFLAASLVLAACGGADNGVADADDTRTTTEPAQLPEGEEMADGVRADWPEELVLSLPPAAEPEALIEDADVLAEALSDRLGIAVSATVPDDHEAVIAALRTGEADIGGGFGPVDVARAMDQAGAEPILQSGRFGEFLYVTQWFTNDPDTFCVDAPVEEIYEDEGEEYPMLFCNGIDEAEISEEGPIGLEVLENVGDIPISFVSDGSVSGQVFPAFALIEAGFELDELDILLAGGHPDSVLSVYNGDATVGVSYDDARRDVAVEFPDVGEEVVVFAWSDPIPNDAFVVRGDLPDDLKQAVADVLITLGRDEADGRILRELYDIDGLRPADPADFENARQVDQELGELLDN